MVQQVQSKVQVIFTKDAKRLLIAGAIEAGLYYYWVYAFNYAFKVRVK